MLKRYSLNFSTVSMQYFREKLWTWAGGLQACIVFAETSFSSIWMLLPLQPQHICMLTGGSCWLSLFLMFEGWFIFAQFSIQKANYYNTLLQMRLFCLSLILHPKYATKHFPDSHNLSRMRWIRRFHSSVCRSTYNPEISSVVYFYLNTKDEFPLALKIQPLTLKRSILCSLRD